MDFLIRIPATSLLLVGVEGDGIEFVKRDLERAITATGYSGVDVIPVEANKVDHDPNPVDSVDTSDLGVDSYKWF